MPLRKKNRTRRPQKVVVVASSSGQRSNAAMGVLPSRQLNAVFSFTLRFQNTAAGQSRINITRGQVLFWVTSGTSTTVQQPVFGSVKIKSITVVGTTIADTGSVAANNTIDLIWGGGMLGEDITKSSSANGMTYTPHITSSPPRNTSSAFVTSIEGVNASTSGTGLSQGAEVLFSIVSQTGTYVDVLVDARLNDTPTTLSLTTTGITAGVTTWNAMDNLFLSGAAHSFDPVGHRNFTT